MAHPDDTGKQKLNLATEPDKQGQYSRGYIEGNAANSSCKLLDRCRPPGENRRNEFANGSENVTNANCERETQQEFNQKVMGRFGDCREWTTERPVCTSNDGVPGRVARLRALGNAVVPQIPEMLGLAIVNSNKMVCLP